MSANEYRSYQHELFLNVLCLYICPLMLNVISVCGLIAPCHQSQEYLLSLSVHLPVLPTLELAVSQDILLIQRKDKLAVEDG